MARTHRPTLSQGQWQAAQPHDRPHFEGLRDAVATLGLCALLIGAGFAAFSVSGDYMANLLGVETTTIIAVAAFAVGYGSRALYSRYRRRRWFAARRALYANALEHEHA